MKLFTASHGNSSGKPSSINFSFSKMSSFEQIRDDIKKGNDEAALAALETYRDDINQQDESGWTLLHWSVTLCDKISKKLLKMGADPNIKTSSGWAALHEAVFWNDLEITELLVKVGADLTMKNQFKRTPLELAIERDHTNIIKYLTQVDEIPLTKRAQ